MIYLASPYSHLNPATRELRYTQTLLHCEKRLQKNIPIFSPIVYGHHFALKCTRGTDAKVWQFLNHDMLKLATEVEVLCLRGWDESIGVAEEICLAKELGKPVSYVEFNR